MKYSYLVSTVLTVLLMVITTMLLVVASRQLKDLEHQINLTKGTEQYASLTEELGQWQKNSIYQKTDDIILRPLGLLDHEYEDPEYHYLPPVVSSRYQELMEQQVTEEHRYHDLQRTPSTGSSIESEDNTRSRETRHDSESSGIGSDEGMSSISGSIACISCISDDSSSAYMSQTSDDSGVPCKTTHMNMPLPQIPVFTEQLLMSTENVRSYRASYLELMNW